MINAYLRNLAPDFREVGRLEMGPLSVRDEITIGIDRDAALATGQILRKVGELCGQLDVIPNLTASPLSSTSDWLRLLRWTVRVFS